MSQLNPHRHQLMTLALILVIALLAIPATPALAQGTVTLNIDQLESGSGNAMTAYVSIRDENGVPVPGLTAQNFTIVEDNQTAFPPDKIDVRVNPRARLSVALVIDLSGTMRDQAMTDAKMASQKLLETVLNEGNDVDRAAFFGINGPVNIDDLTIHEDKPEIGFTNDRNKILNLVNTLEGQPNVATPLYDALFRVAKITSLQSGPRAIIVLTDGQDPKVSKLAADDPIAVANRNNIPIFPIGFSRGKINEAYLTRLAANTGGVYLKAEQASDISARFQEILGQLSEQYVLSYNSALKRDDQPHAVVIRVESAKGKAFDDEIFRFKDVPIAEPTAAVIASSGATETGTSGETTTTDDAASAEPTPVVVKPVEEKFPQSLVTDVKSFVSDKDNLPILIGIVAALLILLALIVFLIVRRSRANRAATDDYAYPAGGYAPISGAGTEGPTAENPVGMGATMGDTSAYATGGGSWPPPAEGSYAPTAYDPAAATGGAQGRYTEPQGAQTPYAQTPYGSPYEAGAPAGGKTVILDRKPQQQVVAILVNRKRPQERYDVVASTNIGRAAENQVVLQDGTVSRQHAKIKLDKGEFRIFDLASANHTYVNDVKVLEPVALKDGDVVKFGEVEFLFKQLA